MGWTFRKRVKLGPINVNLSRSGVGLSAGAGPFRAGVDARGRKYTSVRGPFGLSNRQYYSANRSQASVNPNASALKDAVWVLLVSIVSLVASFSGGIKPGTQVWFIGLALITGIPAVLGLFGYFAEKDASTGWFQVVAAVLKIEKWLAFGILILVLVAAGSGGKKRR